MEISLRGIKEERLSGRDDVESCRDDDEGAVITLMATG